MTKQLIINADDYGICREVNDAIENLVVLGKLQNVSVVVNSWYYNDAATFLLEHDECSVGIHLNVVEGIPVSSSEKVRAILSENREFLRIGQLLTRWCYSPMAVIEACEIEFRAQIEQLRQDGIEISHVDSHQHLHAFPPFWKMVVRLCKEYGIPALRTPSESNILNKRLLPAFVLRQSMNISKLFGRRNGLRTNDHLLGFKQAGAYGEAEIVNDLKGLKDGVTELLCHPSTCGGVPYARYRGELEHQALAGSHVWEQMEASGIELTTWKAVAQAPCAA